MLIIRVLFLQMSIQQMMSGLGESGRNPRVSTSTGVSFDVIQFSIEHLESCVVTTLFL